MGVIKTIWQNRRHFKMQIFGVTVFLVIAIFMINLFTIKTSYDGKVEELLSETVQYTTSFQMSLSGTKGTINNIFVDNSKTRCFILATVNDTSGLTMDASKYQMFITNTNSDGIADGTPKEQLTGEIYMFGTSGRIGFYIESDIPFTNKMKKITLRSYKKYTSNTSPYFNTTPSDAEYDQCHLYFNPGGKAGKTVKFLEDHEPGTDFQMNVIYRQLTTSGEYTKVCKSLKQCTDDMISTVQKMSEYAARLTDNYGLSIPTSPDWIKGDNFENVEVRDENGEVTSSYFKYIPNEILPGGIDFDWRQGTVADGYYHLLPESSYMSLRDYLQELSNAKGNVEKADFKWTYADGSEVEFSKTLVTNYEEEMQETIKAYTQLFTDYLNLKKKYQTEYLPTLLKLEFESETIGQSYTVSRGEDVLITY